MIFIILNISNDSNSHYIQYDIEVRPITVNGTDKYLVLEIKFWSIRLLSLEMILFDFMRYV
jgi:hypothetical protein